MKARHVTTVVICAALGVLASCTGGPCDTWDDPTLTLGKGVGGAFRALEQEEEVGLELAPQGGSGVGVNVLTNGIEAGSPSYVDIQLDTRIDGELTGSFLLEDAKLFCRSDGLGAVVEGVVVGFDPETYASTDDFLELNGDVADLDVTVIGAEASAHTLHAVTIVVGSE